MGYEKGEDLFTRLVADLNSGKLTLRHLEIAINVHVRDSEYTPESAKSILCGNLPTQSGLIHKFFQLMRETIGGFELAIRREQAEKEEEDNAKET